MKLLILLLTSLGGIQQQPILYQVPGKDLFLEFSSEKTKALVEEDFKKFELLDEYTPLKLEQLDPSDKYYGTKVTQQLYMQANDNGAAHFLAPSEKLVKQILQKNEDYISEQNYDSVTDTYLIPFQSETTLQSMKKIHKLAYFDKINELKNSNNLQNTKYIPRPKTLPNDLKTSFIGMDAKSYLIPIKQQLQALDISKCWASSRYEFSYIQTLYYYQLSFNWSWPFIHENAVPFGQQAHVWTNYPCATMLNKDGKYQTWFSEKLPSQDQKEVTFRFNLDGIQRVKAIWVTFCTPPRSYKLEITQDDENWFSALEFTNTPDDWSYKWYYLKYNAEQMMYAKSVKVIMRGFRLNKYDDRHGIYDVKAWGQQQTTMLIEKIARAIPRCLVKADNFPSTQNVPYLFMNCYDAIMMLDGREIFVLDRFLIRQFTDNFCVAPQPPNPTNNQYIVTKRCEEEPDFKWTIDMLGKIESQSYRNKCIAATKDELITNIQGYSFVSVSGTINDSRANPYGPVDPHGYLWWAPPQGMVHATYQIDFDREYTVDKLIIHWKLKPPRVEIQIHSKLLSWRTMINEETQGDVELEMVPLPILGVKILMMDMDQKIHHVDGQDTIFGIKKIQILRPGEAVKLLECSAQSGESTLMNRWQLEAVEYIDTSFKIPYDQSEVFLDQQYSASLIQIRKFMVQISKFSLCLERAHKIRQLIDSIIPKMKQYDVKIQEIRDIVQIDKEHKEESENYQYASSPYAPASDCGKIKKKFPFTKNGFFWVKTMCMSEAFRVYCDFEDYNPNFYVYIGYPTNMNQQLQKTKTPSDIQAHCSSQGLQPLEISSLNSFNNLIQYLQEADLITSDNFSIPIAFNYNLKDPYSIYRSFNSDISLPIDDFLSQMFEPDSVTKTLPNTPIKDAIAIKNSIKNLKKVTLKDEKIRGVICSQNELPNNDGIDNSYENFGCDQTLQDKKIGGSISIRCEHTCKLSKGEVYMMEGGVFADSSLLCKAAVYMGLGNEYEGFQFRIKMKKIDGFAAREGFNHGVRLSKNQLPVIKGFIFDIRTPEEKCPNLAKNKQSFISFDEMIKKVQHKQQKNSSTTQNTQEKQHNQDINHKSFIESNESIKDLSQFKHKVSIQNQLISMLEPKSNDVQLETSSKALKYIQNRLKDKMKVTQQYLKYMSDSKNLVDQQTKIFQGVFQSDFAPKGQKKIITNIQQLLSGFQESTEKLMVKAAINVQKAEKMLDFQIEQFLRSKRFKAYKETYKYVKNIKTLYLLMDAQKMKIDSAWKYANSDIKPHSQAIYQANRISCEDNLQKPESECLATLLEIKFKVFYDFVASLSFKNSNLDNGYIGIVWAKKDPFNYYTLDINKDWVRVRKMVSGNQSIVSQSNLDPPILHNIWYNLELTVKQGLFTIKIIKESPEGKNMLSAAKIVLTAFDLVHKAGSIGLHTDNAQDSYFDNWNVVPLNCQENTYDSDTAPNFEMGTNRFQDLYFSPINSLWDQPDDAISPFFYRQGYYEKTWAMINKVLDPKTVKPLKIRNKSIENGTFGFEVLFEQDYSEFEVRLLYKTNLNYLKIRFVQKYIIIEDKVMDQRSKLYSNSIEALQAKQWYKIWIELTNKEIKINLVSKDNSHMMSLLKSQVKRNFLLQQGEVMFVPRKGVVAFYRPFLDPKTSDSLFQNIKFVPKKDENLDNQDNQDNQEIDYTFDGDKKTDFLDKKESQEVKKQKEETYTWDHSVCLKNKDKFSRETYCQNIFGGESEVANCVDKFCDYCCSAVYPQKQKTKKMACESECDYSESSGPVNELSTCLESVDSKQSMGRWCQISMPDGFRQNFCKRDFCQACCVTMSQQLNKQVDVEQIRKCQNSCKEKHHL